MYFFRWLRSIVFLAAKEKSIQAAHRCTEQSCICSAARLTSAVSTPWQEQPTNRATQRQHCKDSKPGEKQDTRCVLRKGEANKCGTSPCQNFSLYDPQRLASQGSKERMKWKLVCCNGRLSQCMKHTYCYCTGRHTYVLAICTLPTRCCTVYSKNMVKHRAEL